MDIEGSECIVLKNMLDDCIFPTYLCIEFDLYLKKKDSTKKTEQIINSLLEHGYNILMNDNIITNSDNTKDVPYPSSCWTTIHVYS